MNATDATGRHAETVARKYLTAQGLRLLERNFRIPAGEIDLIMADGDTVVFVEVRYRHGQGFGGALESVGPRKQRRLVRAAAAWLQRRRGPEPPARFDVVALAGDLAKPTVTWIPDAFGLEENPG